MYFLNPREGKSAGFKDPGQCLQLMVGKVFLIVLTLLSTNTSLFMCSSFIQKSVQQNIFETVTTGTKAASITWRSSHNNKLEHNSSLGIDNALTGATRARFGKKA